MSGANDFGTVVERVRSEFAEMPCLRLTARQAQRLLALDATMCEAVLMELIHRRFLRCTPDGVYLRRDRN